jgi:hypothetical protein
MTVILICGIPLAWLVGIFWGVKWGYTRALADVRKRLREIFLVKEEQR